MKVQARYQIGYKGTLHLGGERFEIDDKDYEQYKNDVIVIEDKKPFRKVKTKEVKNETKK